MKETGKMAELIMKVENVKKYFPISLGFFRSSRRKSCLSAP
jgi:hypothetical protein